MNRTQWPGGEKHQAMTSPPEEGLRTPQSPASKQFNASDFLNYWCGPLFRVYFFTHSAHNCVAAWPRFQ